VGGGGEVGFIASLTLSTCVVFIVLLIVCVIAEILLYSLCFADL
jgi:hypothetical protein